VRISQSPAVPRSIRSILLIVLIVVVSLEGLRRLSFATDVLEILPQGIPEVEALKVFREHFDDDHKVILLLQHDEEIFEEDAADFALFLSGKLPDGLVKYRSRFEGDPHSFARSLARMWADADPARAAALADQLTDPASLDQLLQESKNKVALSLDQSEATMAAYDPIGFLNHPAMQQLKGNDFSYQSEDGTRWLIMISKPDLGLGYQYQSEWVARIRDAADQWSEEGFSYTLTGGPVYGAEIGDGMEKDMSGTVMMTSIIVGFLFLLVQRSPIQLAVLGVILSLVFVITLGLAGWIFGTLNLVSVGFAAILLGLVIDYGVVIARESKPGQSAADLRREMAPGILWAAFTTAIVFGLLTLSTFTGVRQLGGLILIGLVTGAVVCLWIMPWALEKFPQKKSKHLLKAPFPRAKIGIAALAFCVIGSLLTFGIKGAPKINFEISMLEPEVSEAAQTFETIQELYPAWSKKNLSLIAQGKTLVDVRESLEFADGKVNELVEEGVLTRAEWPIKVLPDPVARTANATRWEEVSAKSAEISATLEAAGFSEKGRALDTLVLEHLGSTPNELDPFARMFYHEDGFFSGRVQLSEEITEESWAKLAVLNDQGVTVSGWQLLQLILLPRVKQDFYFLFLPATIVLLAALIIVFRSWKDAALTAGVLLTVLLLINALSVLSGRPWNFLSSMAIPLIVGTGIDYSIHLIFALRRSDGDLAKVWNGVGKAICFCGLSTVVGFGSLVFASNQTLQSMGVLCGAGVFLTMVLSVLVVPGLWHFCHRRG
jgi:predicted RND superfamily exporter protein